jgi:hypothetical protein
VCRLGKGIGDKDLEGDMLGEMFEALMGAIYGVNHRFGHSGRTACFLSKM